MSARPRQPVDSIVRDSGDGEETLTFAEAAELLRCSRPHVAMLIEAGRLVAMAEGPEPRITRASVVAYADTPGLGGDADYKQAARDAGLYAMPDAAYLEMLAKRRAPKPSKR